MILHLLHMRSNVNRNVFNDRKNVSATVPPFAVHDAHNQGERQQVATFIANKLGVFQQRVSAVLEASQR